MADPESERLILVIFGSILAGVAKAMAFQNRGSTGDEDILGAYFAMKYLKPVGFIAILAAMVSTVFGLGLDFLKNQELESLINTLMYTCIFIFISAETLNNLYRKFHLALINIITRHPQEVGKAIKQTSDHRTFSTQNITGGYSGESLWLVKTIVTQEELPDMQEAIEGADARAFYYHQEVEGVSRGYFIAPIE